MGVCINKKSKKGVWKGEKGFRTAILNYQLKIMKGIQNK